jgi:16S rRNA G966 N2-methylase RsmD
VQVQRGDGAAALAQLAPDSLDLALLDPPFDAPDLAAAALAAAARAVRPGGFVYLEAPRPCPPDVLAAHGLAAHRQLKAGAVVAQLLVKT